MNTITVVAAIFRQNKRILIARRKEGKSMAGYWDREAAPKVISGGKVEAGEAPESALQRELLEELGVRATIGAHVVTVEHNYPQVHIRSLAYFAETDDAIAHSTNHDRLEWILPEEYERYELAEADVPVVKKLTGLLQRG